jgi:hypothetical protein
MKRIIQLINRRDNPKRYDRAIVVLSLDEPEDLNPLHEGFVKAEISSA